MDDIPKIQLTSTQEAPPSGNMGDPVQSYTSSILFSFLGVIILVSCVFCGMWFYRLYTTRGFHLTDFEHLSTDAHSLAQETSIIKQDIERDNLSDSSVRTVHMELIKVAEDMDAGIRVALCAWEDCMQPDEGEGEGDEEDGTGWGKMGRMGGRDKVGRRSHGRYVIGLMREKCLEGVEKRRELSRGLQAMHLEVLSRQTGIGSSRGDLRLASDSSKHGIPRKAMPERISSLAHAQLSDSPMHTEKGISESSPTLPPIVTSATSALITFPPRVASTLVSDDERYEMLGPVQKEHSYV